MFMMLRLPIFPTPFHEVPPATTAGFDHLRFTGVLSSDRTSFLTSQASLRAGRVAPATMEESPKPLDVGFLPNQRAAGSLRRRRDMPIP
jgi:hypothetical protein